MPHPTDAPPKFRVSGLQAASAITRVLLDAGHNEGGHARHGRFYDPVASASGFVVSTSPVFGIDRKELRVYVDHVGGDRKKMLDAYADVLARYDVETHLALVKPHSKKQVLWIDGLFGYSPEA